MLYLVIFGKKFLSYSPKISKKKLVTPLDKIRSALTEYNSLKLMLNLFEIHFKLILFPLSTVRAEQVRTGVT